MGEINVDGLTPDEKVKLFDYLAKLPGFRGRAEGLLAAQRSGDKAAIEREVKRWQRQEDSRAKDKW